MGWPIDILAIHLFLRLLIGLILLSVGGGKLLHLRQFQQGIQEYKVLPPVLEARLALSAVLSYAIPLAELVAGLGLLSGLLLIPAALLTLALFLLFSAAILLNLLRGRRDLSCHCEGGAWRSSPLLVACWAQWAAGSKCLVPCVHAFRSLYL